jgi:hypothetical protein
MLFVGVLSQLDYLQHLPLKSCLLLCLGHELPAVGCTGFLFVFDHVLFLFSKGYVTASLPSSQ